ncbi:MAG: amino acid permease, partial [Methanomassiliicoccales archaeon]|nr:amino acid permease [Methanomassiliicoccales archaeon]
MAETIEAGTPPSSGSGGVEVTLRRDLGLLEVLMIGIGPNIGSTIFVLVGIAIGIAGPAIMLALTLNLMVTFFTALSYAELSSALPETGGGYLWIKEALFPPFGFLGGWMSWVGHCIACAVYAVGFGYGVAGIFSTMGIEFLGLSDDAISKIFAAIISLFFIYMNWRGVKGAGRSQIIISMVLLGIIVTFLLFASVYLFGGNVAPDAFEPFFIEPALITVATSMGFTFMIFEGYEIVAQTGEEAKNPQRTVPRAMFMCITISGALFLVMTLATLMILGFGDIEELDLMGRGQDALVVAADVIVPVIGGLLISVGIIIGSIAAVNSVIFSTSRVSFAMGRDGNLPSVFGRLHPKRQTPSFALFISGSIIIVACISLPINQVAAVADIFILLLFILVNVAAIQLRRRRPDLKRTFTMPLFPLFPIAGIAAKLFLAATLFGYEPYAWWLAVALILVGLFMHYFAKGRAE